MAFAITSLLAGNVCASDTNRTHPEQLDRETIIQEIQKDIDRYGKQKHLVISEEAFQEGLSKAGIVPSQFVEHAENTIFVFTDGECPHCQKAYEQIHKQKMLFEANKINVYWIPIVQSGSPEQYLKTVHLFADSPAHLDTTPRQAREMIKHNTELYATSFSVAGTPLMFWKTKKGIEFITGFPKSNKAASFLQAVARHETLLGWMLSLTEKRGQI